MTSSSSSREFLQLQVRLRKLKRLKKERDEIEDGKGIEKEN